MRNNNLLKMKMGEEDFTEPSLVVFQLDFIIQLVLWKDGHQVHLNHPEVPNLLKKFNKLMILWMKKYKSLNLPLLI